MQNADRPTLVLTDVVHWVQGVSLSSWRMGLISTPRLRKVLGVLGTPGCDLVPTDLAHQAREFDLCSGDILREVPWRLLGREVTWAV